MTDTEILTKPTYSPLELVVIEPLVRPQFVAVHRGHACRIIDTGLHLGTRWYRLDPRNRPAYRVWANECELVKVTL
jgi:hypothetical protein